MIIEKITETVNFLKEKLPFIPKTAVTLGSGLGVFTDHLEDKTTISYNDIPHFFKTTVIGHKGQLVIGKINGHEVLALQGRVHSYEGHDVEIVTFATRVLAGLGVKNILLTNAAGGINEKFKPGDLVSICDHINLTGNNPLIGPNIEELGTRFPDMSHAYCNEMREAIAKACQELNYNHQEGVYAGVLGPSYETPAEVRMLRVMGADMVGMSTVFESIAANHCGMSVGGISCITNMAAGIEKGKLSHHDIEEIANKSISTFVKIITKTVGYL